MFSPSTTARVTIVLALALGAAGGCSKEEEPEPMPMYSMDDTRQTPVLNVSGASHFARIALDCIHREYPNKLNQTLESAEFLKEPRELHPAFYGCFDWHSSVHGHWMLTKLLTLFPEMPERGEIVAGLQQSLTAGNIIGEVAYFGHESGSWERTYGWAWLLQLAAELDGWDDPLGAELAANLAPLTALIRDRYIEFLPRQTYAIRTGVHPNTAFGLAFALDYARAAGDDELADALTEAALRYFRNDSACPLSWEPSGEDFLSPCLEEAALMARVLQADEFADWLDAFLPDLSGPNALVPATVSDRTDGKIVHLDGLNLSRAWDLYIIANHLHDEETVRVFRELAAEHLSASLPNVASEHYEGSHWLASFAIYALTRNH
ncbi:MAG: DUF2891 domain-containing protein [Woeseiaceae bacterium]|nr:DUF2891 domain-containing protein [Woeseiaceae bacterium]